MSSATPKRRFKTVDLTPSPIFRSLPYVPQLDVPIADPLYHILFFQHFNAPETNCNITLGMKMFNGEWYQKNFSPSKVEEGLKGFGHTNLYFSMNNFYLPLRQEKWIKEIRALYVDLDFYKLDHLKGYSPEMIRQKVDLEYVDEGLIPRPSGTIFSGNGLQLIFLVEPVAGVNQKVKRLWKKLQQMLYERLEPLGADPQAIDIPRVFRVAGSINYKPEHGKKQVYFVHHHTHLYSMSQLADDYLPEINFANNSASKASNKKRSKNKVKPLFTGYSLNKARMVDLETLSRLRSGEFPNMRQFAVWLYRCFALQVTQNPEIALNLALQFNQSFVDPLPEEEVIWHTQSAEKKWLQEREEKYPNELVRGYTLPNDKIIEILQITEEEQKYMETIIGKKEKKVRQKAAQEKFRRKKGQILRKEYIRESSENKKEILLRTLKQYPTATVRELATITNISKSTIHRLKQQLKV